MTVDIQIGDCRTLLAAMEPQSVHCCVTSPPYFGLRDYGVDGQLGLEPTPDEFVAAMVAVFREVKRVLRDDGTLWLNLGDSYVANRGNTKEKPGFDNKAASGHGSLAIRDFKIPGKPKDLIGIPWKVAFALQADGWYLRQDIIWHKPNPMPESVTDRCTKAHEYIFLFSKAPRYYFDAEAIKEPAICGPRGSEFHTGKTGEHQLGKSQKVRPSAAKGSFNGKTEAMADTGQNAFRAVTEMRNKRSVWTVSTKPFKGAHFATFPPELIEPCILAGCPLDGTVLDPFGGAGTTGLVAQAHGRNAILCELNPEYAAMARERIDAPQPTKKRRQVAATAQPAANPTAANDNDLFSRISA
jgi:DNA modification methylase